MLYERSLFISICFCRAVSVENLYIMLYTYTITAEACDVFFLQCCQLVPIKSSQWCAKLPGTWPAVSCICCSSCSRVQCRSGDTRAAGCSSSCNGRRACISRCWRWTDDWYWPVEASVLLCPTNCPGYCIKSWSPVDLEWHIRIHQSKLSILSAKRQRMAGINFVALMLSVLFHWHVGDWSEINSRICY